MAIRRETLYNVAHDRHHHSGNVSIFASGKLVRLGQGPTGIQRSGSKAGPPNDSRH